MKIATLVWVLIAVTGAAARADEVPASTTSTIELAQAREFGIFFGGAATPYDLCVKKGFLPKGAQSAEQIAKTILEQMREYNKWTDRTAYVLNGWDIMIQEVVKHASDYTREKCTSWAAREWGKMLVTMHWKK